MKFAIFTFFLPTVFNTVVLRRISQKFKSIINKTLFQSGFFRTEFLGTAFLLPAAAAASSGTGFGKEHVAGHAETSAHHVLFRRHVADKLDLDQMVGIQRGTQVLLTSENTENQGYSKRSRLEP